MQYVIFIHLLVFLQLIFFLAKGKWLNLSKKGHDIVDNTVKFPQARLSNDKQASNGRKRKYDESFLQFGSTFKIVMVMKNFFV